MTSNDNCIDSFIHSAAAEFLNLKRNKLYLLVRLVEPVRVEEEPRLEYRPRWPVGEVTDEEVEVVVAEEVVEEPESSCRLPNEPLWNKESSARWNEMQVELFDCGQSWFPLLL